MGRRRLGVAVGLAGLAVAVLARLAVPSAPPLYDGVVPVPPYAWLDPPPGQQGGAQGSEASIPIHGGKSPLVAVSTPEVVPQAQIFATPTALRLAPGSTSIEVSIQPIQPVTVPTDGHIDGNVYRISVADQAGMPLTAPASARVSVVMRAADPTLAEGQIARYVNGAWHPIKTSSAGLAAMFLAVVTEFGDFAVIAPGPPASSGPTGGVAASAVAGPSSSTTTPGPDSSIAPGAAPGAGGAGPPPALFGLVAAGGVAIAIAGLALRRRRRPYYRGAHPGARR